MDKYITQEEVFTRLCNRHCAVAPYECNFKVTHDGDPGCFTANDIMNIPAADVRHVVCCKDCIHWRHNPGTNRMYCSVWDWINSSTGEDYCSFAERRLEKMEGIEQIDLFPELSRFQKWKNKLTAKIIKMLKRRR